MYKPQIKSQISQYLGITPAQVTLYWKGRVGLYAILDALNIKALDEIIIPAFTCVVVPNAIIYKQAIPVYADINAQTYNIDVSVIEQKITSRTKVIIAQNTFGLSSDIAPLQKIADKHGLVLIEDCTHGFAGTYQDKQNGTIAAASFFSSQWNKTFSTGIGGMVVANDPTLITRLNEFERNLESPSFSEIRMLQAQLAVKKRLPTSAYWMAVNSYRQLTKFNIIPGSSSGGELESPEMPNGYLKGMSELQAKTGIVEIKNLDQNLNHRQMIAALYDAFFEEIGGEKLYRPDYATHTVIKYPAMVKDRKSFLEKAESKKIPLNDWFLSPIHPIENGLEKWNYQTGSNPVGEHISKHIVNLQTDIPKVEAEKTIQFLHANKADLLLNG